MCAHSESLKGLALTTHMLLVIL